MRKPLIGLTANRDDARSPLSVNAAYSEEMCIRDRSII